MLHQERERVRVFQTDSLSENQSADISLDDQELRLNYGLIRGTLINLIAPILCQYFRADELV